MDEKKRKVLADITDFFKSKSVKKAKKESQECKNEEMKTGVTSVQKIGEIMYVGRGPHLDSSRQKARRWRCRISSFFPQLEKKKKKNPGVAAGKRVRLGPRAP